MANCFDIYEKCNLPCDEKNCRQWINYPADFNCSIICANKNDTGLSLREVADRMGVTHVRVQQVEKAGLAKINKKRTFEEN
jgi:hypothetical protein